MEDNPDNPKRRLNVSQAREHLWIGKLRRLPDGMFDRAVKKLMSGLGPSAVAKWLVESRLENPEFAGLQFPTYKKYLCALNQRLKSEMYGVPRDDVSGLARRAVQAEFERQKDAVIQGNATAVQPVKKIWNVVTRAVQELDAEMALKYAFMVQVARVEMLRELEIKDPSLIFNDDGQNEIAVLKEIGAELAKLELKRPRARDNSGRFVTKNHQTRTDTPETKPSPVDENLRAASQK
jgi:hypothetical protein